MKKTYALIENGVVVNITPWDAEDQPEFGEGKQLIDISNLLVGIGFSYSNGVFVAPAQPPVPPKTTSQCIEDGRAFLASQGWTKDALELVSGASVAFINTPFYDPYLANVHVVQAMYDAAKNPETFDASSFIMPHAPVEFGL